MNNEFKKSKNGQYTVYTLESATGGGTSAGSVASVSMPMGGVRKRGDNLIAQEEQKEAPKPRNFVAKNAKMGGAGQHKDKKKAAKQGDVKHKKPFAEAAMAAQAAPGTVKKGGTLDIMSKKVVPAAKPAPQAAAAQPVTPPPPKLGTPPGSATPADMAKLSATVPPRTQAAQPVTPPPPKLGTAPAQTITPPPPPYKPGATTPPPGATPAKPSLGADFEAGMAAKKAGGSPTAMMLAQPSIGGNQQMLDAIASGFGLPKGSTVDDILAADAARTAGKAPVAESKLNEMASKLLSAEDRNGVITVVVQAPDGTKRSLANDNPRYVNQWLQMKYGLELPRSITSKFVEEDHEIQMASSELQSIAKNAVSLLSLVRKYSENDGLEAWQQSKITKAADYLNSVLQSISGEQTNLEGMGRMPGNPGAYDADVRASQSGMGRGSDHRGLGQELAHETNNYAVAIDGRTWKVFADKRQAENIARSLKAKGKNATVHPTGANPTEAVEDSYMEHLAAKVAEKLDPNAPTDVWVQDFQKADPNKYRQFKNKTPAKKAQMAVAAHYAANEPSKKK